MIVSILSSTGCPFTEYRKPQISLFMDLLQRRKKSVSLKRREVKNQSLIVLNGSVDQLRRWNEERLFFAAWKVDPELSPF